MTIFIGLLIAATPAMAWDGAITGNVTQIDLTETGQNFGFRVYLEGRPVICTGGPDWAYLNANEDNYQAIVSALMLAYSSGKTVVLYTNRDASNKCKIGYITVRS
ncbi:hypothetical protein [Parasphingorhabdus litoris]|nr:hypothetical protein [Parasphingorhabdus litoris]